MSITKMRNSFGTWMKYIMWVIAAIFFVGCFTTFGSNVFDNGSNPKAVDKANIAVINDQEISYEQFTSIVAQREKQQEDMMQQPLGITQKISLQSQVLDEMTDNYVKLGAANAEGLRVSKKQINAEIDKLVKDQVEALKPQVVQRDEKDKKKGKITDEEFDKALRKLDSEMLPKSIKDLRGRLNTRETREAIKADMLIKALDKKIEKDVKTPTDAQLMDNYKQVKVRHILVMTGPGKPQEQAKRRAEEVLKKVKGGEDFAKLAKQYSEDPGSKDNGGELGAAPGSDPSGFRPRGSGLVKEFEDAMFKLEKGQISNLVKTEYGYHIIKADDVRVELPKDFQKNKKNYRDKVATQLRDQAKTEYYAKVKKQSKIKINDPLLQGIAYLKEGFNSKNQALAMKQFEKARKERPDDPGAYVMIAQLHMAKGEKDKARKLLEEILEVKHMVDDPELRMSLGQLYQEKKENDKAVKQYQAASELGWRNIQIHYQLQSIFSDLKRPDLAAQEAKYVQEYMQKMQAQQEATQPKPEKPADKKERQGG